MALDADRWARGVQLGSEVQGGYSLDAQATPNSVSSFGSLPIDCSVVLQVDSRGYGEMQELKEALCLVFAIASCLAAIRAGFLRSFCDIGVRHVHGLRPMGVPPPHLCGTRVGPS